jgi:hypothetical protein
MVDCAIAPQSHRMARRAAQSPCNSTTLQYAIAPGTPKLKTMNVIFTRNLTFKNDHVDELLLQSDALSTSPF